MKGQIELGRIGLGLLLAGGVGAQTVSLDNVPPIALTTSTTLSALGLDLQTGNVVVRSSVGNYQSCLAPAAAPTQDKIDKAIQAGNTGLAINASPRISLTSSVPFDYLNRSVANGRRVVSLRVGQPLLCADFAPAPSVGINPVAMQYLDPNGDSSGLLFAGISRTDYFTNGGASSLLQVTADAQLACCIMQPALNASCFQGSAGGPAGDGLFLNGFENLIAAAPATLTVDPVDLAVVVSGPATATPSGNFNYSIEVSNFGTNTVGNVVVRDWYPKASGGFAATLGAGSWTCTTSGSASCGSANGTGNIGALAVSLGAGAKVTFAVSRPVVGSAPNGSTFSVSAAAFAPPSAAETTLSNNQSALSATVSPTSFSISISDVSQLEGNAGSSNFQFTITRSNTAGASSVQVSTADISAVAGSDYSAISSQTVNFTAGGSATAVVNVVVNGDTSLEANETFAVNLSNPNGGSIVDGQGVGTITNDDSAAIAISDVAIAEGNSGSSNASFTVTLTGAVQGGFTVPVSSSNGTATAGSDYTAIASGTVLAFGGVAGEAQTVTVQVNGDSVVEADETYFVNLGTPSNLGVTLTDSQAVGTIINDDDPSSLITTFAPSSSSVSASTTITLNWSSSATFCTGSQGGSTIWSSLGTLPANGSRTFTAPAVGGTVTFQLNCTNGGQSDSRTTQVQVVPPGSCTPIYPNANNSSWQSTFGAWPAYNMRSRVSGVPANGYLSWSFVAGSTVGQFGSVATYDYPGDGDGFAQFSISRTPGCFTAAALGPNCLGAPSRFAAVGWINGPSATGCALTPGQIYYVNLTYGSSTSGPGPHCPSGSGGCGADVVNQPQD